MKNNLGDNEIKGIYIAKKYFGVLIAELPVNRWRFSSIKERGNESDC